MKKSFCKWFLLISSFAFVSLLFSSSSLEAAIESKGITTILQNETSIKKCDQNHLILSTKLKIRRPWVKDPECRDYYISHMIPKCKDPIALASYPGSGNTWVRHLLEHSLGIFTGSRYKDLQIQMAGMWGEIRRWNDGTTIVQKTHDASKHHVVNDFKGKAILILRNPYEAIISMFNFLYSGHNGRASESKFLHKDWKQFVTIQMSKWLDMATNWTIHSSPRKVHIIHNELLKENLKNELGKVISFLGFKTDYRRISCTERHKTGYFRRQKRRKLLPEILPFNSETRRQIDKIIDYLDGLLRKMGYEPLPLRLYKFYNRSDQEIVDDFKETEEKENEDENDDDNEIEVDKTEGTKMVLKQYLKVIDKDSGNSNFQDLFEKFQNSPYSGKVTDLFVKAVDLWPSLKQSVNKDPIEEIIESDGFRGKDLSDLALPNIK